MALDYEYTTVDVDLLTHPKALAAGLEAMGLWLWAMAWSHKNETNGKVPRHVVGLAWGGAKQTIAKLTKRLVLSGLWVETDEGWEIWNYSKKNQSAEEKRRRREQGRERMARFRDRHRNASGNTSGDASRDRYVREQSDAPDLICDGSGSREGVQGEATGVRVVVPETGPPAWFGSAIATVEFETGEKLRPADSWLRYSGHRTGKGITKTQQDAVYWLTTVMVPEARKERRAEANRREREAKWDRQRAGPGTLTEDRPVDPEVAAKANAEFLAAVRKIRKGAA